ncbi:MAG: type II toxin-antitoxin system RelE/ParE family toxin [Casimicrobiaceae bacterium]
MAGYRLLIKPSAAKEVEAIGGKRDRQRVVFQIRALAAEPHPVGCEKLAGIEGRFRLRQGDYRVVYFVDDTARTVEVVKVGHRREVYRGAT